MIIKTLGKSVDTEKAISVDVVGRGKYIPSFWWWLFWLIVFFPVAIIFAVLLTILPDVNHIKVENNDGKIYTTKADDDQLKAILSEIDKRSVVSCNAVQNISTIKSVQERKSERTLFKIILWLTIITVMAYAAYVTQKPSKVEAVAESLFDKVAICKAAISVDFGAPVQSVSAKPIDNDVTYVYYHRVSDGKYWDYNCKVINRRVVWSAPGGRWRDNYKYDNKLTYYEDVKEEMLIVNREFFDGSSDAHSFTVSEINGRPHSSPNKIIFDNDERLKVKKSVQRLIKKSESGELPFTSEIKGRLSSSQAGFTSDSFSFVYGEKSYSYIDPTHFSDDTVKMVADILRDGNYFSNDESSLLLNIIFVSRSIDIISSAEIVALIIPKEEGAGVIGIETRYRKDESEWKSMYSSEFLNLNDLTREQFLEILNDSITHLISVSNKDREGVQNSVSAN